MFIYQYHMLYISVTELKVLFICTVAMLKINFDTVCAKYIHNGSSLKITFFEAVA